MGSQPDVRAVCTHKAPLPQGFLPTSGGTCLLDAGAHRSLPVDELATHYPASGGGLWSFELVSVQMLSGFSDAEKSQLLSFRRRILQNLQDLDP